MTLFISITHHHSTVFTHVGMQSSVYLDTAQLLTELAFHMHRTPLVTAPLLPPALLVLMLNQLMWLANAVRCTAVLDVSWDHLGVICTSNYIYMLSHGPATCQFVHFFSVCTPSDPCQNGGTCDETTDTCMCPSGYSGDLCNECELVNCVFEYVSHLTVSLICTHIWVVLWTDSPLPMRHRSLDYLNDCTTWSVMWSDISLQS